MSASSVCSTCGRLLLALALLCSVSRSVGAQVEPDSVKLRNDCRLAEQVLLTGHPLTHRADALSIISRCGEEGVPALLSAWDGALARREDLEQLVTATRAFVDPRLTQALFATLGETAKPTLVRIAALLVLTTYGNPYVVPSFDDLLVDPDETFVRYGEVDHPFTAAGRDQLPSDFVEHLRSLIVRIENSDPSTEMRTAARVALANPPLR